MAITGTYGFSRRNGGLAASSSYPATANTIKSCPLVGAINLLSKSIACQHIMQSEVQKQKKDTDISGPVCDHCASLNLDRLLENGGIKKPSVWESQYVLEWNGTETCIICQFFDRAIKYQFGVDDSDSYSLFQFSVQHDYGLRFFVNSWKANHRKLAGRIPPLLLLSDQNSDDVPSVHQNRIDYGLLRKWISGCCENHVGYCQSRSPPAFQSLVVIDCGEDEDIIPSLTSLPQSTGNTGVYVALSYVWGLAATNVAGFSHDVTNGKLPKVIADAIITVRALGYRYLWVDRYCVPQDKEQLKVQIENMGRIYRNAELTIIAAAGDGPEYGLPGVSTRERILQPKIQIGKCVLTACHDPSWDISHSKWNTRGWTFQEGILSRRILAFTEKQVYFQCHEYQCLEMLAKPLDPRLHYDVLPSLIPRYQKSLRSLHVLAAKYMLREFARPEDSLRAFRGILRHFMDEEDPVTDLCGLAIDSFWVSRFETTAQCHDFLSSLLSWKIVNAELKRKEGLPSWSWVGWASRQPSRMEVRYVEILSPHAPVGRVGLLSAHVEFESGEVIPWYNSAELVCLKTAQLSVRGIRILGWICAIKVESKVVEYSAEYFIAAPKSLSLMTGDYGVQDHRLSFGMKLDALFAGDDDIRTFECLLLASELARKGDLNNPRRAFSKSILTLVFLKKLNSGTAYERLDCFEMESSDVFETVDEKTAMLGDIQFTLKEMFLQ